MKSRIPTYRGKGIRVVDAVKLNNKDQKILNKYITDVSGSAGSSRTKKVKRELLVIRATSEVDFDKWDYDVLSKFLEVLNKTDLAKYTKNDYKKTLKHFLRFQYDDWNIRFKGLKHNGLKQVNPVNKEKISKETLLKPNEFELLVRGCDKPMFRVWIHLSYMSAGRPEEILKLKFGDCDLETGRLKLVSSKTGNTRYIYVDEECIKDILQYKNNEYAYPNPTKEDFIFVSPAKRTAHTTMPTLYSYLKTITKKRLNRTDIFPYLFRHTKLNEMRKVLSPDAYEMFSDHSLETGMKFYSHNDDEDLRDELYSKVFKKKDLPPERKHKLELEIEKVKEQNKYFAHWIQIFTDRDLGKITQKEATLKMKALAKATNTEI